MSDEGNLPRKPHGALGSLALFTIIVITLLVGIAGIIVTWPVFSAALRNARPPAFPAFPPLPVPALTNGAILCAVVAFGALLLLGLLALIICCCCRKRCEPDLAELMRILLVPLFASLRAIAAAIEAIGAAIATLTALITTVAKTLDEIATLVRQLKVPDLPGAPGAPSVPGSDQIAGLIGNAQTLLQSGVAGGQAAVGQVTHVVNELRSICIDPPRVPTSPH